VTTLGIVNDLTLMKSKWKSATMMGTVPEYVESEVLFEIGEQYFQP
jgi:hypothetical protein